MHTFCVPSVSDIQPLKKKQIYYDGRPGHLHGINIPTAKYTAPKHKHIYKQ